MMPRQSIRAARIAMLPVITACAANHQPTTVPVAGASVYVDDADGGGLPIVFIHGNGGSSKQWSAQLQHFRIAGRRAIAADHTSFPELETVRLSGTGHWLMLDKPTEVNAAIDAFLGKLP